jgi:hypothetical protein
VPKHQFSGILFAAKKPSFFKKLDSRFEFFFKKTQTSNSKRKFMLHYLKEQLLVIPLIINSQKKIGDISQKEPKAKKMPLTFFDNE